MCNPRHSSAGRIITDGPGRPAGAAAAPHPSSAGDWVTALSRLPRTGKRAAQSLACNERKLLLSKPAARY